MNDLIQKFDDIWNLLTLCLTQEFLNSDFMVMYWFLFIVTVILLFIFFIRSILE